MQLLQWCEQTSYVEAAPTETAMMNAQVKKELMQITIYLFLDWLFFLLLVTLPIQNLAF